MNYKDFKESGTTKEVVEERQKIITELITQNKKFLERMESWQKENFLLIKMLEAQIPNWYVVL